MASTMQPLVSDLPLTVIANALSRLDSADDLYRAILSHRVFLDAFKDNSRTIVTQILNNRIPGSLLPYALALLHSSRLPAVDDKAVHGLMERLETQLTNPDTPDRDLLPLSLSDRAFISRNHAAVESLSECFVKDTALQLCALMGTTRDSEPSQEERFRIARGFYRYQIMCNLCCINDSSLPMCNLDQSGFLSLFSPWTNDQLRCIYVYLEDKASVGKPELQQGLSTAIY